MGKLNVEQAGDNRPQMTAQGCSLFTLLLLSSVWVLGGSLIALLFTWSLEQAILDGAYPINDIRWVIVLAFGGILLFALLIVTLWTRVPRMKAIFRTWMLAAVLALILAPARLLPVTSSQLTVLFQIAGLMLYILGLWFLLVRPAEGAAEAGYSRADGRGMGLALVIGLATGLPWVLAGALGSPLDTLLALVAAALFGAASSLLLTYSLQRSSVQDQPQYSSLDFWMDGFAASMTLLILVVGFAMNNFQWVLALALPAMGWAAVGISHYGRGNAPRPSSAWPAVAVLLGLATAWPLLLVDPLELAIQVTGGPGELISYILRASQQAALVALAAGLVLAILRRRLVEAPVSIRTAALGALAAAAAVAVLYSLGGQPGFHGDHVFVVMRDQADLSGAASIDDPQERREYVYDALVQHAEASQADLRAELDRLNIGYTSYYLENALEVHAGALVGARLASRPDVDRVLNNPYLRPLPDPISQAGGSAGLPTQLTWNLSQIGVDQVWAMGITGEGIVVGQSDSGVQYDHPELANSYRGREQGHDYNWHDAWFDQPVPYDYSGHGTHTLAIAVGNRLGVAPDAEWIGCANMARNFGSPAYYLECLQFLFAPYPHGGDPFHDGQPALGAHVLNNSWGCPPVEGCDASALGPALDALRSAGVFVVVSAGNNGSVGCDTIRQPPANLGAAYSVGAVDVNGTLAMFSSLGQPGNGEVKPELVAPGVDVLSAYPGSSYAMLSGTSMAAPHVTGTVTLMWSANPSLIGKIDRTVEILNQTASAYMGAYPACIADSSLPNAAVGYGVLNAAAAVQMALEE